MTYDHLREISIMPCLATGLSVEDRHLQRTAASFGSKYVLPDAAFGDVLAFLNISKRDYLAGVRRVHGTDLTSPAASDRRLGAWRSAPAADWRTLRVAHDRTQPSLLSVDQLITVMDNASYGGQLAIAGYVDVDLALPRGAAAVQLVGRFQIGIVDYIWGSGYTETFDGSLTVDVTRGQMSDAPGYAYDGSCDFVVDYFRFRSVAPATLPPGLRFDARRNAPMTRAA